MHVSVQTVKVFKNIKRWWTKTNISEKVFIIIKATAIVATNCPMPPVLGPLLSTLQISFYFLFLTICQACIICLLRKRGGLCLRNEPPKGKSEFQRSSITSPRTHRVVIRRACVCTQTSGYIYNLSREGGREKIGKELVVKN